MVLSPSLIAFHRLAGASLFLCAVIFLVTAMGAPVALAHSLPFLADLGFNTALCIGLLGLALAVTHDDHTPYWMVTYGVTAALAMTSLLQYVLAFYPPDGPWRLLLNTTLSADAWPGRMSVPSACIIVSLSAAGWLLNSRQPRLATAVYLPIGLGILIALGSFSGHLVGLVIFVSNHPNAGYMSPASSLALILAGAAAWQVAGRRTWVREWRSQAPGIDLFVQAAVLLAMFLVVGGLVSGSLMLEGRRHLAAAIILILAPAGAALLYWRIVPVVERIQRAEADLRVASRQQALLLHHAGQGIFGLDSTGCITFANPAAVGLLGHDANDLVGRPIHPLLHGRRRDGSPYPLADCPIHATLQDGVSRHIEGEVFWHRDGHAIEVEYDVAALREDAHIIGAVVLFNDVSGRLRLLEDLKRWKLVFQLADWGVAISNAEKKTLALVNPAFARMHGYSVEELQGRPIVDILAPTVRPSLADQFRQIHAQNHLRFESLNVRKDGQVFNVLVDVTVVRNERGHEQYHVVNVLDISEQVAREDQLRHSETSLAQAQAQAQLGSWWLDIQSNVLQWSDETYRIFGIPIGTAPLTYATFLACVHPEDRAYVDEQWRAGMAGAPYDIQHRCWWRGRSNGCGNAPCSNSTQTAASGGEQARPRTSPRPSRRRRNCCVRARCCVNWPPTTRAFARRNAAASPAKFTTNSGNISQPCAWMPRYLAFALARTTPSLPGFQTA